MPRLRGGLGQTACALVLAAGALVGGCGGGDGAGADGLATLVPPDAPLFAEFAIRPGDDQAAAIDSFAERVAGVPDPGAAVTAQLDAFFADHHLQATYADDVEPWLGDRAAFFVSSFENTGGAGASPEMAAMVEVDDSDAAREFVQEINDQGPGSAEQRSYEGADYYLAADGTAVGVIDDHALVVGTETAFMVAVDASRGESLAESAEFGERADALPADPLASVFLEPAAAIEAALASEGVDPAQARMLSPVLEGLLSKPIAATFTASPGAASLDLAAMLDTNALLGADPALLADLPAGSWFAVAVPELGNALAHALDQLSGSGLPGAGMIERRVRAATGLDLGDDVLGWIGDARAFVSGTTRSQFSAGLIAEADGPQAPRPLLEALQGLVERASGLRSSGAPAGADHGFSIDRPGPGGELEAGVFGDTVVAVEGTTAAAALEPSQKLGDDAGFQAATAALGSDFPPGLYLELPAFFRVAELGSDGGIDYNALRPYLGAFSSLVAGSRVDGDLVLSRFTVSLAGG
ncbi:MAG: hypothetical protein QOI10_498 [Solirubrobacterales bacterium]|jgi:hypothetical protein|nr:hypothetical protein [Solirubrobacterales bacterium]